MGKTRCSTVKIPFFDRTDPGGCWRFVGEQKLLWIQPKVWEVILVLNRKEWLMSRW